MSEDNVWLAGRRQEQDALGRIILTLEQTSTTENTPALRGGGVAARTDAITGNQDSRSGDARALPCRAYPPQRRRLSSLTLVNMATIVVAVRHLLCLTLFAVRLRGTTYSRGRSKGTQHGASAAGQSTASISAPAAAEVLAAAPAATSGTNRREVWGRRLGGWEAGSAALLRIFNSNRIPENSSRLISNSNYSSS